MIIETAIKRHLYIPNEWKYKICNSYI